MQILKKEMRDEILAVAKKEILERGYKNASLRIIAKGAHTTLGNLYNYFDSKEAILETIIGDMPERLDALMEERVPRTVVRSIMEEKDIKRVEEIMEQNILQIRESQLFLQTETIILLECCEGTKYENYKERFYDISCENLLTYLRDQAQKEELKIYLHAFEAAFIYIAKTLGDTQEGRVRIKEYIKLFLVGLLYRQRSSKININFISNL